MGEAEVQWQHCMGQIQVPSNIQIAAGGSPFLQVFSVMQWVYVCSHTPESVEQIEHKEVSDDGFCKTTHNYNDHTKQRGRILQQIKRVRVTPKHGKSRLQ